MRRRWKKKGSTWGKRIRRGFRAVGVVAKLARDVNYLRSVVNVEKKYIDVSATPTSSTTVAFVLLNGLVTGSTATSRLGQSIKMISVYPNLFWSINAAAATTYVRVIIFIDKQANGAAPAGNDLLVTSTSVLSPLAIANSRRFKVLMDIRKTLSLNGNEIVRYKRFRKLQTHVEFNTGNAGTIADIQTNSLYLMHMSDQPAGMNVPTFSYNVRTRFIDN